MFQTIIDSDKMSRIITKWKDQLEAQYLAISDASPAFRRVYICSPCAGETPQEVKRNVQSARFYMWYTFENMQLIARAPHAYLPILLSDKVPSERALALEFGLKLLEQSELLFVCGNLITYGMRGEISKAAELNIPITVFDRELLTAVRKIVTRTGGNKELVQLHEGESLLHLSPEQIMSA